MFFSYSQTHISVEKILKTSHCLLENPFDASAKNDLRNELKKQNWLKIVGIVENNKNIRKKSENCNFNLITSNSINHSNTILIVFQKIFMIFINNGDLIMML